MCIIWLLWLAPGSGIIVRVVSHGVDRKDGWCGVWGGETGRKQWKEVGPGSEAPQQSRLHCTANFCHLWLVCVCVPPSACNVATWIRARRMFFRRGCDCIFDVGVWWSS